MAKLVRVSRNEDSVIIEKAGGWLSVVNKDGTVSGSADSLSVLTASGQWRRPVDGDVDKYKGLALSLEDDLSPTRAVRVPKKVKDALKEASKNEANKKNIPFLLTFSGKETVTVADVQRLSGIMEQAEKNYGLLNSEDTANWVKKIFNPEPLIAAASFEPSDELEYYAISEYEDSTEVSDLYALTEDFTLLRWEPGEFVESEEDVEEFDRPAVIPVDDETAAIIAEWVDAGKPTGIIDISTLVPEEFSLFQAAMADLDFEEIDRAQAVIADASGAPVHSRYVPPERSANANRQIRGADGKFAGEQVEVSNELTAFRKATLPDEVDVILDPATRISEYVENVPEETDSELGFEPLYLALVDDVDRTAVVDVVVVGVRNGETIAMVRRNGGWEISEDALPQLQGEAPPAVVELIETELVQDILSQIDSYDADQVEEAPTDGQTEFKDYSQEKRSELADKGWALPDGSFPIADVADLKNAVQAYGRSKEEDRSKVRGHIARRARALNRRDLIPDTWNETGAFDFTSLMDETSVLYSSHGAITAAGIPGIADTPSDWAATERLKRYWTTGPGGVAKIRWYQHEGNLTRCATHLAKYIPGREWGFCNNLHKRVFGYPNPESGGR